MTRNLFERADRLRVSRNTSMYMSLCRVYNSYLIYRIQIANTNDETCSTPLIWSNIEICRFKIRSARANWSSIKLCNAAHSAQRFVTQYPVGLVDQDLWKIRRSTTLELSRKCPTQVNSFSFILLDFAESFQTLDRVHHRAQSIFNHLAVSQMESKL